MPSAAGGTRWCRTGFGEREAIASDAADPGRRAEFLPPAYPGTATRRYAETAYLAARDQRLGATVSQSGSSVTAGNASRNGAIPAGGEATFGLPGAWASGDGSPTAYSLDGVTCVLA